MTGKVRDLAHDGDGIVATEEGILFVPGALPGEVVRVRPDRSRGKNRRGRLLEILEASGDRVEAACPMVDTCGGCPQMVLSLEGQRALKTRRVEEATGLVPEWIGSPDSLGYRRRARLAWQAKPPTLGYRRSHRRTLVDVGDCPVLVPALAKTLEHFRTVLRSSFLGGGELRLAVGRQGGAVGWIGTEDTQGPAVYGALGALVESGAFEGLALRVGDGAAPATWGDPVEWTVSPDGDALMGTLSGFSQSNDGSNRLLVERVMAYAQPAGATVLELYSGFGNLTVPLARRATHVRAVEADPQASSACGENLRRLDLADRVTVVCGDAAAQTHGSVDVLVLDPPRTGAADVIPQVGAVRPSRIVYVSCDPGTLRRDLAGLGAQGYRPEETTAVDMFPHTAHVESVTLLVRN
ncbi:MAG: class I SAM-dependent RNA methyltransferase [Myxococcales bacterium]|nr:class I SAM-dependent RNA methyltransferase [Myxococcales bacterium]